MKNNLNDLTSRQKDFLLKLKENYGAFALPSYETIRNDLKFKSKNSIKQYIEVLKEKDFIFFQNDNLYLKTELFGAKLVSSSVKAGFASIMDDKIEKRISMDEIFDINSPSTFVFKVSGDSMSDIGILDGDFVIIKKTPQANIGDIVLACIDNEFTLKTYKKDK